MTENEIHHEVDMIWHNIDINGNGTIDFTEFQVAAINKTNVLTKQKLKKAFQLFDLDNSGSISSTELKNTLGNLIGKKMSDQVWIEMIKEVDLDGSGEIEFEEFQ